MNFKYGMARGRNESTSFGGSEMHVLVTKTKGSRLHCAVPQLRIFKSGKRENGGEGRPLA